ncbi:hypothetical protein LOTGIDRAFT_228996 [Lottia gigantea]|uniref:S-(hydroxymethyl)glutathione dehydrogenase n=1 Tax=Lottia gigantea TaxID=225164 RepID=V4A715_LOTGI|nr:hypothetical protein LOTGIDRAFT_228996 [Lottia gigantea]ESO89066.1 hypothetical protein LOTGIDRAFT_228996 [Lottia gigantea]
MASDTLSKKIRCKAAVLWEVNTPLVIETIEVEPPRAGEVRIKILATGVCKTDAYLLDRVDPSKNYPVILGHEGAGIVESVGEGVTNVAPGDHVVPLYYPQCYQCKFCKNPKTNFCSKVRATQMKGVMPDGTSRFRCNGKKLFHFMGCSTFSEYTVVADVSVCKVDSTAPSEKVCLLGCSISTGYGAVVNTAQVESGSTCAVWGLGAVGLAVIMGCKIAGAKRIIGVDINSDKFKVAEDFGCTEFINPKDYDKPIQEVIVEKTDGGCDYTFECIGSVEAMRASLDACHKGWGVSTILGMTPPGAELTAKPYSIVTGCVWKGSVFGGWKSQDSLPTLVEEYMQNKLKVDEFVSFTLPLAKINEGFDYMRKGVGIKSVVIFD